MKLWIAHFDEPRFEKETPHSFSWGYIEHATIEEVKEWLHEQGYIACSARRKEIDDPLWRSCSEPCSAPAS